MNITRSFVFGIVASVAWVTGEAADFNERLAAWQSGAATAQRMQQRSLPTEPTVEAEEVATEEPAQSPRQLGSVYGAPLHNPNYSRPWGGCYGGHVPTFAPPSDDLGTCNFSGGQGPYNGWPAFGAYAGGHCAGGGCGVGCNSGYCGWGAAACKSSCWGGGCDGASGADACGSCLDSCCDPCLGGLGSPYCSNSLVWLKTDVLLWWRQGRDFPPLVTTDPTTESSTTAGILPNATTLFGGGRVGNPMQVGGRFDLGVWSDTNQICGYGWRFFGLGRQSSEFNITSDQNPVLAVPFFNRTTGANDALLVAFPGLRTGEIHISGTSEVVSNDLYGKTLWWRDYNNRLDFITGWNYTRVGDAVQINTRSVVTQVGGNIPVGTVTTVVNRFVARNEFNGGILGLNWQHECGPWSSNVLARTSLGNLHQTMAISGFTQVFAPNQAATTTSGGLFAGSNNIGDHSHNAFTAIWEAGYTLGYRFAPTTQLTIGYTLLYWSDFQSAAGGIDPRINNPGTASSTPRAFTFRHSDFWVQGLNIGLAKEF